MKLLIYIFLGSGIFCLTLVSCKKLIDVTDIKPVYQLSENEAITTVSQAQSVLYGTYGLIKTIEITSYNPGLTSLRGLTMQPGSFGGATENAYFNNEIDAEDYYADIVYTAYYKIINNANHIIAKAPLIQSVDARKEQIIGEAYFIRALAHFELLRLYGYFFDTSSPFGIVLKDKSVENAAAQPRNTVQESYALINSDLDKAITMAPHFYKTFYASSEAAMALKAKVLLYQKQYEEAAALALQVIRSGKFELETSFSAIFSKKIINTKEVIFQTPFDDKNDRNNKAFIFRAYYIPSVYYAETLEGDNRDTAALVRNANGTLRNKKYNGSTFNGQSLTADTEYFLRLDELYLILAEAAARSNDSEEALKALNKIRNRAGMPDTTAATLSEILEAIRIEKILELGAENGEEWYDLVRYDAEGDLNIKDFKPGVTSEARFVLPVPYTTVNLSNGIIVQNPGF